MAGTVTVEETAPPAAIDRIQSLTAEHKTFLQRQQPLQLVKWTWTSDASGDADQVTTYLYAGIVAALTTDPGAAAPTDNYNVTINDSDGFDVLGGDGALRDTATTETEKDKTNFRYFGPGILNLVVDSAGDSKQGVVYLWIRRP